MKRMIVKDLNNPEILKIEVRSQMPQKFVCFCPESAEIDELNIIDDIDQMTGEIIGKKAVICPKKCAEKEAAKLADEEAEKNRLQQRADKIAALKENGSQDVKDLLELLGL